jgi:hypothetical protein
MPGAYGQAILRALLDGEKHSAGGLWVLFVNGESIHKPCSSAQLKVPHKGVVSLGFAWRTLLYTAASPSEPCPLDVSTEMGHAASKDGETRT